MEELLRGFDDEFSNVVGGPDDQTFLVSIFLLFFLEVQWLHLNCLLLISFASWFISLNFLCNNRSSCI